MADDWAALRAARFTYVLEGGSGVEAYLCYGPRRTAGDWQYSVTIADWGATTPRGATALLSFVGVTARSARTPPSAAVRSSRRAPTPRSSSTRAPSDRSIPGFTSPAQLALTSLATGADALARLGAAFAGPPPVLFDFS